MDFTQTYSLKHQLQQIQHKKMLVEKEMTKANNVPQGTVSLSFHRMKRQRNELQNQITKINGMIRPDIIA
jgi:hypothetical protein